MRCFLGIPLSEKTKEKLFAKEQYLRNVGFFEAKFVEKKNLHITVAFLGEKNKEEVMDICKGLREIVEKKKIKKFKSKIKKIGFFPNAKNPKIVWAGFDNEKKFSNIREKFNPVLGRDKRFHPHITFARIKKVVDKDFIKKIRIWIDEAEKIEKINMYKSVLSPKGPVYSIVDEIWLK